MPSCPSCQRPVATSRPTCLYCGATVATESAGPPGAELQPAPASEASGLLLGYWPEAQSAASLAAALDIEPYEARQRVARRGPQLWRLLDEPQARAEAARLEAAGLATWLLPEAGVRRYSQPSLVTGGGFEPGLLRLRACGRARTLPKGELLLVVRGPIARQPQDDPETRYRGMRSHAGKAIPLEPGYRFHLHLRANEAPLELDPAAFEFEDRLAGRAPYLSLHRWLSELGAPGDDSFRQLTPALSPAEPEAGRAAGWLADLGERGSGKLAARVLLDNLRQFRFFSAWRGLLERERPPA